MICVSNGNSRSAFSPSAYELPDGRVALLPKCLVLVVGLDDLPPSDSESNDDDPQLDCAWQSLLSTSRMMKWCRMGSGFGKRPSNSASSAKSAPSSAHCRSRASEVLGDPPLTLLLLLRWRMSETGTWLPELPSPSSACRPPWTAWSRVSLATLTLRVKSLPSPKPSDCAG